MKVVAIATRVSMNDKVSGVCQLTEEIAGLTQFRRQFDYSLRQPMTSAVMRRPELFASQFRWKASSPPSRTIVGRRTETDSNRLLRADSDCLDGDNSSIMFAIFDDFPAIPVTAMCGRTTAQVSFDEARSTLSKLERRSFNVASSWPPTPATSCSTRPAVPAPPPPSPSNGAAAGSRSTPRASRWRWPVPASWAHAIRSTCWPIPAKARSRKPKSPAPHPARSRCTATSATASSMSACRTSR